MIVLDDFVMLGKTVPEPNSDGRVFVCSAGYSATLRSLVRIYPLARSSSPPRWSITTVPLERNPKDSRRESFQIAGDRRPGAHDEINGAFSIAGVFPASRREDLLRSCVAGSIGEANERRLSLALLHPDAIELEFELNPSSPASPQLALFQASTTTQIGARRFPFIPRLLFRDGSGDHRLMLRDWGVYELMRKNDLVRMSEGERRRFIGQALHLDPSCSLLIGNQNNRRTAWLVISVLRGLRSTASLLDEMVLASEAAA